MGAVLRREIESSLARLTEVEIRRCKLGLVNTMPKATRRVGLEQK